MRRRDRQTESHRSFSGHHHHIDLPGPNLYKKLQNGIHTFSGGDILASSIHAAIPMLSIKKIDNWATTSGNGCWRYGPE